MTEQGSSEAARKEAARSREPEAGRMVPLHALPAPLRKLLTEMPRKEWYRIKAVRANFQETVELVAIVNALEYLLDVSPKKLLRRVIDHEVEGGAFEGAYREIRDRIAALRDKCLDLGSIAGIEVKAWTERRGQKSKGARPPERPPEKEPAVAA
jgi:hypothetical protein